MCLRILALLVLCMLLPACGKKSPITISSEIKDTTSSMEESREEQHDTITDTDKELKEIEGHALESLGYHIDAPQEMGEDPNSTDRQYHPHYRIYVGNKDYEFTTDSVKMHGEFTLISVQVAGILSLNDIASMYLQAFYEEELLNSTAIIKINEKFYSPEQLSEYKIWSDNHISVYNFYDLVCNKTFAEQLSEYTAQAQNEPSLKGVAFSWLNEIDIYFKDNISNIIKRGHASYITQNTNGI